MSRGQRHVLPKARLLVPWLLRMCQPGFLFLYIGENLKYPPFGGPGCLIQKGWSPKRVVLSFPKTRISTQSSWNMSALSGPILRIPRDYLSDIPLLRAMGSLVSQHDQFGAIPLPPFWACQTPKTLGIRERRQKKKTRELLTNAEQKKLPRVYEVSRANKTHQAPKTASICLNLSLSTSKSL